MAKKKSNKQRKRGMAEHGETYVDLTPEETAARSAAIREARAAIKAGDHVSIEQVKAWIESWDTPNELPMPTPRKR